ncbi:MAG: hypothetical protein IKJ45_02665 [Kiritimatiellae bacterium]|nr:hypothetical protein [Kiritimatiellia bacterium]
MWGQTLQNATRKLRVVRVGLRQMDGIGFRPRRNPVNPHISRANRVENYFCGILIPHLLEALREKRKEDLTQTGMGGTFHFVDLHLRLWIVDLISAMQKCTVKIV